MRTLPFLLAFTLLPAMMKAQAAPSQPETTAETAARHVYINRHRLDDATIRAMEQQYRTRIQDGRYWYDHRSGAWGLEGGPTVGFIMAGLDLPGPLPADASGGNTGVFVNGRELHYLDVAALYQITGMVLPGRYWCDANGNVGFEGGPAVVNLIQLAQARGGNAGGAWSYSSPYGPTSSGSVVGGDGSGFLFYSDGKTSWTN